MRRAELAALGVQLPVLATVCPVPLPPGVDWPERLARIGLDIVATGAGHDTPDGWAAAARAVPHRPTLARATADTAAALVAAGCRLLVLDGEAPEGAVRVEPGNGLVVVDGATAEVEDVNLVARRVLAAARAGVASELWITAGEGLVGLPVEVVEAKLAVLVDGARQARLWLAKEQFDRD